MRKYITIIWLIFATCEAGAENVQYICKNQSSPIEVYHDIDIQKMKAVTTSNNIISVYEGNLNSVNITDSEYQINIDRNVPSANSTLGLMIDRKSGDLSVKTAEQGVILTSSKCYQGKIPSFAERITKSNGGYLAKCDLVDFTGLSNNQIDRANYSEKAFIFGKPKVFYRFNDQSGDIEVRFSVEKFNGTERDKADILNLNRSGKIDARAGCVVEASFPVNNINVKTFSSVSILINTCSGRGYYVNWPYKVLEGYKFRYNLVADNCVNATEEDFNSFR